MEEKIIDIRECLFGKFKRKNYVCCDYVVVCECPYILRTAGLDTIPSDNLCQVFNITICS